jgi:hypothetical protein
MKLADHSEKIRQLINTSFRNRMGRMGISASGLLPAEKIPSEYLEDRRRIENIYVNFMAETGSPEGAYEKLIEEFTFTLFNRLAALKVMEAHKLHAEILTRQSQHGNRSFAQLLWLEQNPQGRGLEQEGLVQFLESQFSILAEEIPLFSLQYLFHLLPTAIELNGIINAFNQIETDEQVEENIWISDDVLGWLYESYNNYRKIAHKESGDKTEYNKVSIQSQVYTPRWVVKFLVDNSLGKLYLEMYPDSEIKNRYKIANAPKTRTREQQPLTRIRLIDLANGSGNFLLYGFDLFYDLYIDQIEKYGADYTEGEIPELIIQHNLHGIDLDDRAVQLAQLGLYIKAKRKKHTAKVDHFNIVSSDFFLPEYDDVKHLFENDEKLKPELEKIVTELWEDLQQAFKFGSLLRVEEKFSIRLHELVKEYSGSQKTLFGLEELANYEKFRENFFENLLKAVAHNVEKQGHSFLNTKTGDAITYLKLMTQKYDVAVANPPYTDSGDYGPELKTFIEDNYKKPYKFNTNLYATFIKKCCEIVNDKGKLAIVHPPTFMYIKSFEDVRKYIIEKMHISLFVEWGYLGMFNPLARVDSAMYVLENEKKEEQTHFIKLNDLYEGKRYDALFAAYDDLLNNRPNSLNYTIDQSKLKIIEGWPFIYWISDEFREKFKGNSFGDSASVVSGVKTGDNERLLRFWWEVDQKTISDDYYSEEKTWVKYAKGGPFNKWYGNVWLIVNYRNNGSEIKKSNNFNLLSKEYIFRKGITYSATSSKGVSFRLLEEDQLFDMKGSSILFNNPLDVDYALGILNSYMSYYLADALNSTVETQIGDVKRIPFIQPPESIKNTISFLVSKNIEIKKYLCTYHIIETNFLKNPLVAFPDVTLRDRLNSFLSIENALLTLSLLNEAIINNLIFSVYSLSPEDRHQVETKMGKPVGSLPINHELKVTKEKWRTIKSDLAITKEQEEFVDNLPTIKFEDNKIRAIKEGFTTLYQSNNDLEEFCIRHQVNPINVWYWFRESKVLPPARAAEVAMEFIADSCRSILMEDEDGIIPLTGLPGEPRLLDRLEQHCLKQGFTSAQFMQLEVLLGKPINEYIEHHFFKNFSDHLNQFMYLPKTPFIWHLCSGEHQGFEAYIIIYKWNRDSLFKLKTKYLSKRIENLEYRQLQIASSMTAQAQNEKGTIRLQLQEIASFTTRIDELIAEGYNPKLDDGVGKNIAPLQKKGLLRCEVLNKKQLDKYLNADW